jgi:DNA-directed RNA polymerase specialized sigma24 family protein
MPRQSDEAKEFAESVEEVLRRFIPDLVTAFKCLYALDGVAKKDDRGRTHLRLALVPLRRKVVAYLFESGFNPAEISNRLRIPIMDVYNDIRRTRRRRRGKIKP